MPQVLLDLTAMARGGARTAAAVAGARVLPLAALAPSPPLSAPFLPPLWPQAAELKAVRAEAEAKAAELRQAVGAGAGCGRRCSD